MKKIFYQDFLDKKIIEILKIENFKVLKVLKNDKRSYVALIEILDKKYVYKIPKEKNTRKWQRVLSIFRGSESKREYLNYVKAQSLGFNTPVPIMYLENIKFGMCIDSFIIMTYIYGKSAKIDNLNLVVNELKKIHSKGFLHGDSQLDNFMIKDKEVYLIDTKILKNRYKKIGEAYEFIYLEESCHQEINIYNKNLISYKIAKMLNTYLHFIGNMKKKIRRKDK